jgi:hypothetical protein
MTEIDETRLLAIIEAHGADPGRWPAEERDPAVALLETSAVARRALDDAARLDTLLAKDAAPKVSLALQSRVAAIPERRRSGVREIARVFWPFGAIWRPATGLVAAGVIGLIVGIGTPPEDIAVVPGESEAYGAVIAAAGGEIEENPL